MPPLFEILREGLIVTGVLCVPLLAIVTCVGLAIAIVQAATQVQEQTIPVLPKMLAVAGTLAVFGPFALSLCASLFRDAVAAIPAIVFGT
jgi:flagellar biosynthesis protein FliQ